MTDKTIIRPPAELFNAYTDAPDARTVIAEVRSDASIPFDPKVVPNDLTIAPNLGFGALIFWRAEMSWTDAQDVHLWLTGGSVKPGVNHRERALKEFFEIKIQTPNNQNYLNYIGTYISTGTSSACYTLVLGMRSARSRDDYRDDFERALKVDPNDPNSQALVNELLTFFKLMLNKPSSCEEFLTLGHQVNLSTVGGPDALIGKLI